LSSGSVSGNGVNRDLAAELAYNLHKVEQISKADALKIVSNWERQNKTISVMCFSSAIALSSKNGRVALCLDECFELRLGDESGLRIFTTEASFSKVGPEDFPAASVSMLPIFQNGIRVEFQDKQMQWYLLA
jgi:hypothetical protein